MTRAQKIGAVGSVIILAALLVIAIVTRTDGATSPRATVPGAREPRTANATPEPAGGALATRAPALPGGAFSGRVLDWSTGEGIADARVTFDSGRTALTAETDASGAFTLEVPAPGRYVLAVASAGGYWPLVPDWGSSATAVVARPGMRIDGVTLFLKPAIDYLGLVEAPDGSPVTGATVRLLDGSQGEQAMGRLREDLVSDGNGEFRFHAPDDTVLEAWHPSRGSGRARVDRVASASRRLVIRLTRAPDAAAPEPASISGRVVDRAGAPVAAPRVRAAHVLAGGMHPRAEARGGPDGRFRIDGLDPGMHLVWVVCEGCASARARAMTGSDITLVVGQGGAIAGQVIDAAGEQPVPAFAIQVIRRTGQHENVVEERSVIDADGRFEVDGLPAGEYEVRAAARGHVPSPPLAARVVDGAVAPQEIVLRLPAGGTIHGTVSDRASGAWLEGARVTVERSADLGWSTLSLVVSAATDRSGGFTLAGVSPGIRSVRASAAGHHTAMVSGLRVEPGARLGPIALSLAPTREGEQPGLEVSGIGAKLKARGDALVIDEVIPGGGAALAGLLVGDGIVEVDGQLVSELGVAEALERLRGPEGTRVLLEVRPADGSVVRDVAVERREVRY